jgi:hypothetical protein
MEPDEPNQKSLEETIIDEIDRELAQAPGLLLFFHFSVILFKIG